MKIINTTRNTIEARSAFVGAAAMVSNEIGLCIRIRRSEDTEDTKRHGTDVPFASLVDGTVMWIKHTNKVLPVEAHVVQGTPPSEE